VLFEAARNMGVAGLNSSEHPLQDNYHPAACDWNTLPTSLGIRVVTKCHFETNIYFSIQDNYHSATVTGILCQHPSGLELSQNAISKQIFTLVFRITTILPQ
jgi:hypothetical protein